MFHTHIIRAASGRPLFYGKSATLCASYTTVLRCVDSFLLHLAPLPLIMLSMIYTSTRLALVLTAASVVMPAYAGTFGWVDRMFTFREDQKERVAPKRVLPPKEVTVPYIDERANAQWSAHYRRADLDAKNYLHGSASKVMRPADSTPPSLRVAHPQGGAYFPGYGHGNAPDGYMAMVQRDQLNQIHGRSDTRVYIGDPGTGPGMHNPDSEVAGKTQIGKPVASWRDAPGGFKPSTRPGDYDYRAPQANRPIPAQVETVGGTGRNLEALPSLADNGTAVPRRSYHPSMPTRAGNSQYSVQQGDTLSGIADKPQIYNDWSLWPMIYDANRGTLNDPDYIRPNQRLDIPRDYTRNDANNARQRAYKKDPTNIRYDDGM